MDDDEMTETTTPSGADVDPLALIELQEYRLRAAVLTHSLRGCMGAELREARTAVAALIARNAELEAERVTLGKLIVGYVAERDALSAENRALREVLEELACAVHPMLEAKIGCDPITVVDPDPRARHPSVSTWSPYPLMSFRSEDMFELKRMYGIATEAVARTPAKENDDG